MFILSINANNVRVWRHEIQFSFKQGILSAARYALPRHSFQFQYGFALPRVYAFAYVITLRLWAFCVSGFARRSNHMSACRVILTVVWGARQLRGALLSNIATPPIRFDTAKQKSNCQAQALKRRFIFFLKALFANLLPGSLRLPYHSVYVVDIF